MKEYVKPDFYYESFQLSESIATACGGSSGSWIVKGSMDLVSCYAEMEGAEGDFAGVRPYANSENCNYPETEDHCYTVLSGSDGVTIHSV